MVLNLETDLVTLLTQAFYWLPIAVEMKVKMCDIKTPLIFQHISHPVYPFLGPVTLPLHF